MPNPPKSPLESFFDRMLDAAEDAAEDLIRDVNKQARENIRRMGRQIDQTTSTGRAATRVKPATKGHKRSPGTREPGARPTVTPPPVKTLYTVLEVSPTASPETISAAFRSLSSRFHPDNQKTGNEVRYKEITAAWSVLKDPVKRKRYDKENHE